MQEFSAISVSSYEAGSLADRLTEQSHDGWSVVAIVPTGSTVTAYLCREAEGVGGVVVGEEPATDAAAAEPAGDAAWEPTTEVEPTLAPIVPAAAEPAAADVTPAAAAETFTVTDTSTDTSSTAADTAATETAATAAASAGAAPAGWYADPSGRFELRYWDGGQWTEHVSRAGQQYTDPPVA
jgi:hypothetical protein